MDERKASDVKAFADGQGNRGATLEPTVANKGAVLRAEILDRHRRSQTQPCMPPRQRRVVDDDVAVMGAADDGLFACQRESLEQTLAGNNEQSAAVRIIP